MVRHPRFSRILIGLLLLLTVATLSRSLWLGWLGGALVRDEGPSKADFAVVLAGDYYGRRITKAAELVRAGYVPTVLVSGPAGMYGVYESELAIAFAVRRGYPAQWFVGLPNSALSTREEAPLVLKELRRRGVHRFLLVTSSYHTARAGRTFEAAARQMPDAPSMRVVAAPDEFFSPDSWWQTRQGQKAAFFEWCKTFATVAGL